MLVGYGSGTYGNGFEAVTPVDLREEHAQTFNRVWRQTRPLRYLRQTNLCRELAVPWVYLLGLYYESSVSLFIADSDQMVATVRDREELAGELGYRPIERSLSFPSLASADLEQFVKRHGMIGENALLREFRQWLQNR